MAPLRKVLLAVVLIASLPMLGCTQFAAIEGVSVVASDKTLGDHVVSFSSGKDCSSVRLEQGKTYCVEDEPQISYDGMHCYQTLGDVVCYTTEDRRASSASKLGISDHNVAH